MSKKTTLALPAIVLLLGLGSCTSSRFYDHRFQPAPLEVEVGTQAVAGSQVRTLVTVIGIQRAGEGQPASAIVRMRLENLGSAPARLETESMSLVSADLVVFGPARIVSADPAGLPEGEIAAGGDGAIDLMFPLPEGRKASEVDLSGLNLRFTLRFGEHGATAGATFRRVEWGYWDPGSPRLSIGVGITSD
ncbi:MAG: hypothetical protein ACKVXR_05165 [Planctomycetota bacterium]